jgi:hypothetical protein
MVSAGGCVDASLYSTFSKWFEEIQPSPYFASSHRPLGAVLAQTRALLPPEERPIFDEAVVRALKDPAGFVSTPFHCVVGVKR